MDYKNAAKPFKMTHGINIELALFFINQCELTSCREVGGCFFPSCSYVIVLTSVNI